MLGFKSRSSGSLLSMLQSFPCPHFGEDLASLLVKGPRELGWRGVTALLSQCVSFSLIDVGRVSSAYIVFLFFPSKGPFLNAHGLWLA
eukprot:1161401-Pelagomonas_calceolata.AAC.19